MPETILLIEENIDTAESISGILRLAHYDVLNAEEGKAGVRLAMEKHPDLILCDVTMSDIDGYSVFHILNKDPFAANIPFIFLTSHTDQTEVRHAMNLGADDYMTKPFDGHDLLKVVEVRLKKKALLKASFNNDLHDVNSFFTKARELKEFSKLSQNRAIRTYRKRDFLFMEGQPPYELYFIIKGEVKTYMTNKEGKELITGIYKNGDFVGYAPILEEIVYTENAMVIEDTQVVLIPKQDFLALIYSSRDIAHKFIQLLSNNLIETENRLLDLAYQSVRQRVAGALLRILDQYTLPGRKGMITISRRDISNMIGTATESLNRTLGDFQEEGLIDLMHEGIRVIERVKLEKIAR
jgi:CRP-like cAMP-binding protein